MNQRKSSHISGLGTANPLCVSSILTRASNFTQDNTLCNIGQDVYEFRYTKNLNSNDVAGLHKLVLNLPQVDIPITIRDKGKYITIKFEYKGHRHTTRLNSTFSELSGNDIFIQVTKIINEIDGDITLGLLLDFYLEKGTGSLTTRKKNAANAK